MRSTKRKNYYFGFVKDGHEAGEWLKCYRSPIYFMKKYVKIDHPKLGLIPFRLYLFQDWLVRVFLKKDKTIILKPRQMGITTIVAAYALWFAMFRDYKNVILISIKYTTSKAMLKRIKTMYKNLPDFLKAKVANGTTPLDVGNASEILFSNGSAIKAVASSEDAARSEPASLLIMDELAFQAQASGIWASAQPSLSTGGKAILLSTAFGMGNFFHREWTRAVTGESGLFPVKLKWQMHPDRTQAWYERQRAELGAKRCAQEIDCDFLRSGFNVFNMDKLRAIEERLKWVQPQATYSAGFEGTVYQYFTYDPTEHYYIGADIATGRSKDSSAFSILDTKGKEYACYKGKIHIRQFAELLTHWGYSYGGATLAPEANAIGEGVIAHLQTLNYPNVFHSVSNVLRLNEWENKESDVMGWFTTGKSRHEIIAGMDEDLDNDIVELYNPYFVHEGYTFIYDQNNKAVALGKRANSRANKSANFYGDSSETDAAKTGTVSYSDDAILGACITNEVRKKPNRFTAAPVW